MELNEVYNETVEEKTCMLKNTFDTVWYEIREHINSESVDKALVGFIKKLAEYEDADGMLECLIDMETKMKKMKAAKLVDKPKDSDEGADFITIVMQWYGPESEESEDWGIEEMTSEWD